MRPYRWTDKIPLYLERCLVWIHFWVFFNVGMYFVKGINISLNTWNSCFWKYSMNSFMYSSTSNPSYSYLNISQAFYHGRLRNEPEAVVLLKGRLSFCWWEQDKHVKCIILMVTFRREHSFSSLSLTLGSQVIRPCHPQMSNGISHDVRYPRSLKYFFLVYISPK